MRHLLRVDTIIIVIGLSSTITRVGIRGLWGCNERTERQLWTRLARFIGRDCLLKRHPHLPVASASSRLRKPKTADLSFVITTSITSVVSPSLLVFFPVPIFLLCRVIAQNTLCKVALTSLRRRWIFEGNFGGERSAWINLSGSIFIERQRWLNCGRSTSEVHERNGMFPSSGVIIIQLASPRDFLCRALMYISVKVDTSSRRRELFRSIYASYVAPRESKFTIGSLPNCNSRGRGTWRGSSKAPRPLNESLLSKERVCI